MREVPVVPAEQVKEQVRIGSLRYTYRNGKVSCSMFGYIDDYADEPTWCWRWSASDQCSVEYMLERYPELAVNEEVILY